MTPSATDTVTLYRPVGPKELALIEQSGFRAFPPRLPWQPIFHPVLNEEYATQIARDWNVRDSGAGFVTRVGVWTEFLSNYEVKQVGGRLRAIAFGLEHAFPPRHRASHRAV